VFVRPVRLDDDTSRLGEISWCVERARASGRRRIAIHSTDAMLIAHGLHRTLLRGFVLDLAP
jgi:hypothetical protein